MAARMGVSACAMREWESALREGAAELGLTISEEAAGAYRQHFALLLAHNRRAGLTTITDPAEIAVKHFLDSLTALLVADIGAGDRAADVGSGGGFPGVVLAAARPQGCYLLIEANQRRAGFLVKLTAELCLREVSVVRGRAEEVGREPGHRGKYDWVLGRAVAPMPTLLEYCLPLARVGGAVVAHKGPEAEEEMAGSAVALEKLGGRARAMERLSLPRGMGERVLVVVEKTGETPEAYPRRPGIPRRRPLGRS